jgi:hypothetical protein
MPWVDKSKCAFCGRRLKMKSVVLSDLGGRYDTCGRCGRVQPWAETPAEHGSGRGSEGTTLPSPSGREEFASYRKSKAASEPKYRDTKAMLMVVAAVLVGFGWLIDKLSW